MFQPAFRRTLTAVLAGLTCAPLLVGVPGAFGAAGAAAGATADPAPRAVARRISYTQWDSGADFRAGTFAGTRVSRGRLVLAAPTAARTYQGHRYSYGRWVSPWTASSFGLTELVSSWSAATPGGSWVEVQVRGRAATGATSSWDVLGRWASTDSRIHRTSVSGQSDDLASVDVDTWKAASDTGFTSWQLRVALLRPVETPNVQPAVDTLGAMASRLPDVSDVATSAPGPAAGIALAVPRYSQMVHRGDYTQWGGGGEAWCSPTSTSMVLGYYHALPPASAYSWVPAGHVDPWVDYAARMTYDTGYAGTGNWPFNTAYAAGRTGHAFVTRLRSLREAEAFIVAGIPLVVSISFASGRLSGAPISASNGHLVVIRGFTATGDVLVNDPAASTRAGVRRTYDRGQFEDAWIPRSGGLAYVITDAAHPLPGGTHSNW